MGNAFHRLLLPALVLGSGSVAAPAKPGPAGIYDGSQTELAATLELKASGRFAYWTSYGAIDEVATGTWREDTAGVVLDSDPVNPPRFSLTRSGKGATDKIHVRLHLPVERDCEGFAAQVTLASGENLFEDFSACDIAIPLGAEQVPKELILGIPMLELRSPVFPIAPGQGDFVVDFAPNDIGAVDFDHKLLPLRDGCYVLARFDRTIAFCRVEP